MSPRIDLYPFPTGWYALCFSGELRPGRPLPGTWLGQQATLHRQPDGAVRVEGAGWPVQERLGAVMAWHDPAGRPPQWNLPVLSEAEWTPFIGHCWPSLATHPQETSENSVDVAHFETVHGYSQVLTLEPATTDGPVLQARYAFTRRALPFGVDGMPIRTTFRVQVHGLGFSLVQAEVAQYGLQTRQLVLSTPTDGEHVALRIAVSVRRLPHGGSISPWLRWVPGPLIDRATRRGTLWGFIEDVSADLEIWQTKRHLSRPRLAAGDGPIGPYRAWCRQFYPPEMEAQAAAS